jgi:hypothetical protein
LMRAPRRAVSLLPTFRCRGSPVAAKLVQYFLHRFLDLGPLQIRESPAHGGPPDPQRGSGRSWCGTSTATTSQA